MKYSIEREAVADGDSRLWAIKRRAVYGCLLYWTAIFLLIVTIVYSSVARNLIRKSVVVDVDSLLYAFVVIGVALSIVYYLSMRKTLNKAFAEIAKLEDEKDENVAIVMHDLKSPVTTVRSLARLGKSSKENAGHYFDQIYDLSGKLYDCIETNIDISDNYTGKAPKATEPANVSLIVAECAAEMRPNAEAKGLKFELDIEDGVKVMALSSKIKSLVNNLVGNSVKYTEAGCVNVSLKRIGPTVRLQISDTGPGMSNDVKAHMYDRSYRAGNGSSKGNGLGLKQVKSIVTLCHGAITCKSELGKGTKFTVLLPAAGARG